MRLSTKHSLFFAGLLNALHYFLIVYINSTFLSQFISTSQLSILYIIGSLFSIGLILLYPRLTARLGNSLLAILVVLIEIIALAGMGLSQHLVVILVSFGLFLMMSPLLFLNLDVLLEMVSKNDKTTGKDRGAFLTMQNIAQIACPLLVGWLVFENSYSTAYSVSIIFLVILLVILLTKLRLKTNSAPSTDIIKSIAALFNNSSLSRVVMAQYILRFFYAWMVIYTPLYLIGTIGFSWTELGIMFSIMLLPFLLLEYPLGKLMDSTIREKPVMVTGFIVLIAIVILIPLLASDSLILWTGILFLSRIGAACVEIATESYFFRHVTAKDIDKISVFRVARPATYIAAATLAVLALSITNLQWSFIVLGSVCLVGLLRVMRVRQFPRPSADA